MRSARGAHHTQKARRALIYDHYKTHKVCLLNRTLLLPCVISVIQEVGKSFNASFNGSGKLWLRD